MDENKANNPSSGADHKKPAKNESAFPLERLAKDCHELFGITPSTFHGAVCGLPKDCTMTVAEMKSHIEKWLATPINLNNPGFGGTAVGFDSTAPKPGATGRKVQ